MKSFVCMILSPFVAVLIVHLFAMYFYNENSTNINHKANLSDTISITVPFEYHNIYTEPIQKQIETQRKNNKLKYNYEADYYAFY